MWWVIWVVLRVCTCAQGRLAASAGRKKCVEELLRTAKYKQKHNAFSSVTIGDKIHHYGQCQEERQQEEKALGHLQRAAGIEDRGIGLDDGIERISIGKPINI
jgi:hypothetical protein